jgi:hypothetical protein
VVAGHQQQDLTALGPHPVELLQELVHLLRVVADQLLHVLDHDHHRGTQQLREPKHMLQILVPPRLDERPVVLQTELRRAGGSEGLAGAVLTVQQNLVPQVVAVLPEESSALHDAPDLVREGLEDLLGVDHL